jgi:hypothetical protein
MRCQPFVVCSFWVGKDFPKTGNFFPRQGVLMCPATFLRAGLRATKKKRSSPGEDWDRHVWEGMPRCSPAWPESAKLRGFPLVHSSRFSIAYYNEWLCDLENEKPGAGPG